MAFVCTVDLDDWRAEVFQNSSGHAVLMRVGYDDERNLNYFAFVCLDNTAPGGQIEYVFSLIEVNGDTGDERNYWNGRDVARFIAREDRALILELICRATFVLVRQVSPESVFRITHEPHPPEVALEKHYRISKVFAMCGYEVTMCDPYHGKRAWLAERVCDKTDCHAQSAALQSENGLEDTNDGTREADTADGER